MATAQASPPSHVSCAQRINRPAWPRGKLHRHDGDVTGQQRACRSPVAARPAQAHASSTPGASVPVAWRAMYLRPRNVLQRVTARAAPLRAASPTTLIARASCSNPIRLLRSPPSCLHRFNKVRTSPFPACAAPAPPLRISASTAAPSAPPPCATTSANHHHSAYHAARLRASSRRRGRLRAGAAACLLAQSPCTFLHRKRS